MNLLRGVPGPIAWTMRIIGWLVGLAIIGTMAAGYGNFKLSQRVGECLGSMKASPQGSALSSAQELVACAYKRSGVLERVVLYHRRQAINSLPHVPCLYVGTWSMTRPPTAQMPAVEYRITLRDDSRFIAQPVRSPDPEVLTGSWGVHGTNMLWFYDQGLVWPPDINPIKHTNDGAFTLREREGSITSYTLLQRAPSDNCVPKGGNTVTTRAAPAPQTKAAAAPAAPAGPPRMRPAEGLTQAQSADYQQLAVAYMETFRVLGRAKACNHPDADARMQTLLKEMEQRHGGNDNILMTAVLGFAAGNENRRIDDKQEPPPPVPCEMNATQMANVRLPDIPASLLVRPGDPIDRTRYEGQASTGPYQIVARTSGEQGPVEYVVVHREKVAFSSRQPFDTPRLVATPTPVLVLATQDRARQCADGKPYLTWQAVSLPAWGDAIVTKLDNADCMVVWEYTDANGRPGLCAWQNSANDRRASRIFRVEDHGAVTLVEERRAGACPR